MFENLRRRLSAAPFSALMVLVSADALIGRCSGEPSITTHTTTRAELIDGRGRQDVYFQCGKPAGVARAYVLQHQGQIAENAATYFGVQADRLGMVQGVREITDPQGSVDTYYCIGYWNMLAASPPGSH